MARFLVDLTVAGSPWSATYNTTASATHPIAAADFEALVGAGVGSTLASAAPELRDLILGRILDPDTDPASVLVVGVSDA